MTAPADQAATAFLVAGAAHWDLIARTDAPLPPGADVPGRIERRPGGVALNVALALAALRRPVTLVSALGTDAEGDALAATIAAAGITGLLTRHPGATGAYLAIETADGSLLAGVADCATLDRAGPTLPALRWTGPLVLDGNLAAPVLATLADAALGSVALVPASPRKAAALRPLLGRRPMTLYLNLGESEALAGRPLADTRAATAALLALGVHGVVVTDGPNPATAAGPDGLTTLAPPAVTPRSVTGAGDAFVAAHLAARADGLGPEPALANALAAAARQISREVA